MKRLLFSIMIVASMARGQDDLTTQILTVKRVFVDKLTGGETAAQMRDLLIASLQGAKLFVLTENPERADMTLKGAAEDLIFTDSFSSSEGVNVRSGASVGSRANRSTSSSGAN